MKAIIKECGKEPRVQEIGEDLGSLQKLVGGLIEPLSLDEETDLICNDEGKISGLDMNVALGIRPDNGDEGDIADIIHGDVVIVGVDASEGRYVSLTDEQIGKYMTKLTSCYLLTQHLELVPVIELF